MNTTNSATPEQYTMNSTPVQDDHGIRPKVGVPSPMARFLLCQQRNRVVYMRGNHVDSTVESTPVDSNNYMHVKDTILQDPPI